MDRGNSPASRDIAFQLHPYTHLKKHEAEGPLVLTEGKGVYVTDENGNKYIEGLAGLWCVSLGYGEERLIEAATRQMRTLPYSHIFNHKSHNPSIDLAERLLRLLPVKMSKVFFNNSGSEANDTRSSWSGTTTTRAASTARRRSSRARGDITA
jgi:4-aminobutyrate--pyruvate transaminase